MLKSHLAWRQSNPIEYNTTNSQTYNQSCQTEDCLSAKIQSKYQINIITIIPMHFNMNINFAISCGRVHFGPKYCPRDIYMRIYVKYISMCLEIRCIGCFVLCSRFYINQSCTIVLFEITAVFYVRC